MVLVIVVILAVVVIGMYVYTGGFPVGFSKGKIIINRFSCADLCPNNGRWQKEYFNVKSKEECERVGGEPRSTPAGAFITPQMIEAGTAGLGYYACLVKP